MQRPHVLDSHPQPRAKEEKWLRAHEPGQQTERRQQQEDAGSERLHPQQQIPQSQLSPQTPLEKQELPLPQAQQRWPMQQQVDGHLRPGQQQRDLREAQSRGEQWHVEQQNNDLQQQQQQRSHPDPHGLTENHQVWERHPPSRAGEGEISAGRGKEEVGVGGGEHRVHSQFMAWPGGATLASALWNAQEKVVHHFKQLQLLENPFTVSTPSATREISPPQSAATTEGAQALSPLQRPLFFSPSPLSAHAGAAAEEAAAAEGGGSAGTRTNTAAGITAADSAGEPGAAAAAAAAVDAVPIQTVTAETLVPRRTAVRKPAPLLPHDTTPYKLVTFANGRPLHVHHVCSSPPSHAETGRSFSIPGKTNRERQPHEAAGEPVSRSELKHRRSQEQQHRPACWVPVVAAAGTEAAVADAEAAAVEAAPAGAGGGTHLAVDRQSSREKHSAVVPAAAGDAEDLLDTFLSAKSSLGDDIKESNDTSGSSKSSYTRKLAVGGEEATRPSPAVGDVGTARGCMVSASAPAAAASLPDGAAVVAPAASSATATPDGAAVSSARRQFAAAGSPKTIHCRAGGTAVYCGTGPASTLSGAEGREAAADMTAATVPLAAARDAGKAVVVSSKSAADTDPAAYPSFVAPAAAYEAAAAEHDAEATQTTALLQLIAATRQLASISWELLLLCVMLPLLYLLYFSASPVPASSEKPAAAAGGAPGPDLLPSSSCVNGAAASPGFLVHALITVYLLVVGSAAWNLWRLQLPQEMYIYTHLACLLPAVHGRGGRRWRRPTRAASAAAGSISVSAETQAAATAAAKASQVRRTVSAAAGYGGGYLTSHPLRIEGEDRQAAPTETGGQDSIEAKGDGTVTVAPATGAVVDSPEPPADVAREMVEAEESSSTREVLLPSRKSTDDEMLLPPYISPFPSSASISTFSDTARAAEYCRYELLENLPPPASAPPPPPSDWPQWPVLLRATQEPWIAQKTQEVLQQHMNRIRKRGTASNEKNGRDVFLPTLRYPPAPLLFMTPEVLDPRQAVISFETPFFRGRLFVCIPSPGSSATKKQQGPYGKRAMQACVQGQFLHPYRVGEVLTGQAFFRPLRSLPPQWMVSLGLKVAKQLTSTLQEDIFARMPYFLTPAVCSVETLHVAHSRTRLSEGREGEQGEQQEDEEEEYIAAPDVTLLDVPEETRLLGGPFAEGGISPQQRKSMLSSKELLGELVFDPDLIYTFNFVQNIFFPSTYEFDLGIMKLDLAPFLNHQPIEVMALIDDAFVRDSSPSLSRRQSVQKRRRQKQRKSSKNKKEDQEGKRRPEMEASSSCQERQEAETANRRDETAPGAGDAETGHGDNAGSSAFEGNEKETAAEGFFNDDAAADEEERRLGTDQEEEEENGEEEEIEDADPRKWVPPENGKKFAWQFQMWHAKLLVKED